MKLKPRSILLAILGTILLAPFLWAAAAITDNSNVAVPANNGTSSMTNITSRAQMYVGFYGNVSIQVRNDTTTAKVLYNRNVSFGKLYFFKTGATPGTVFVNASTNTTSNNNFSLSGVYNLSYNFDVMSIQPLCGVNMTWYLNTTDQRQTGILYDNTATPNTNYFFCTELGSFTSTAGFGPLNYEIIVAKTPSYMAYDIWLDLQ